MGTDGPTGPLPPSAVTVELDHPWTLRTRPGRATTLERTPDVSDPNTAPACSTASDDTAFSRVFPTSQALQARYRTFVQQQCQRYEDQGMSYLLYTVDPRGAGQSLFPQGTQFHGPVTAMAPTGLDAPGRNRIYFTESDRALVEEFIARHEALLVNRADND